MNKIDAYMPTKADPKVIVEMFNARFLAAKAGPRQRRYDIVRKFAGHLVSAFLFDLIENYFDFDA